MQEATHAYGLGQKATHAFGLGTEFFSQQVYLRYTINDKVKLSPLPLNHAIIPYKPGYEYSFCHIMHDVFSEEFKGRVYEFTPGWLIEKHGARFHIGEGACYFCEFRGYPIGFILISRENEFDFTGAVHIVYMGILEKYQGNNYSRFLIEKSIQHAHQNGAPAVITNTRHPAAYRMYMKCGFEPFFRTVDERAYYNILRRQYTWVD